MREDFGLALAGAVVVGLALRERLRRGPARLEPARR
jgi:hypothetical protein